MKLQMVGCSHHNSSVEVRERIAFSPDQARAALAKLRSRFPESEAVLLSTCNRIELYTATESEVGCPSHQDVVQFVADFHGISATDLFDDLYERTGEDAVRHLFTVAASLDSMVVGEAQILSQVKQAYELARAGNCVGTLTNQAFQAAIRVAKRVAHDTEINQRRVSIPSVAVADFAKQIYERFDDKNVLLVGAGEMGEETLTYLLDEGARNIKVVSRSFERAAQLAQRLGARAFPWSDLEPLLVDADLIIGTTGSSEPVVDLPRYQRIEPQRQQRTLFILDLAVPRDFAPEIADCYNVYLFSIDDLKDACDRNRRAREKEWPKAQRIIDEETNRFIKDLNHRATVPLIRRLRQQAKEVETQELMRLMNKLGDVDQRTRGEIEKSFDRLVNKLLHPPLESLRSQAEHGEPHGLLEALKDLFRLRD